VTTLYTIGHSTRSGDEFLAILRAFAIELVADIRTVPRSRRNPQFDQAELQRSLAEQHIQYVHLPALGGLRRARKDSINTGWQNASFRGYADYMQTAEFASAIEDLIPLAKAMRTVIMCAEAVPWRCHRSLAGDALIVRGVAVEDIMSETKSKPHKLTSWARVDGLVITYPDATWQKPSGHDPSLTDRPN
jgi:uncharacterized protein (DUF488 family)